jgi:hypothetical protein
MPRLKTQAKRERDPFKRWIKFVMKEDRPNGCWLWNGTVHPRTGYGQFRFDGRLDSPHCFAYRAYRGPIPEGMEIDHTCHVASECQKGKDCPHRRCVNPKHLRLVVHPENMIGLRKKQCKDGHPLSGDNLYTSPNGKRHCRACMRRRQQEFHEKHPEVNWYNDRRKTTPTDCGQSESPKNG